SFFSSKRRIRALQISKRRLRVLQISKRRIRPSVNVGERPKMGKMRRPERFRSHRRNVRQVCRGQCKTEGSYAAQPWKRFAAERSKGRDLGREPPRQDRTGIQ